MVRLMSSPSHWARGWRKAWRDSTPRRCRKGGTSRGRPCLPRSVDGMTRCSSRPLGRLCSSHLLPFLLLLSQLVISSSCLEHDYMKAQAGSLVISRLSYRKIFLLCSRTVYIHIVAICMWCNWVSRSYVQGCKHLMWHRVSIRNIYGSIWKQQGRNAEYWIQTEIIIEV